MPRLKLPSILELAERGARANFGEEGAEALRQSLGAREATLARRAEAEAIGRAQERRGAGRELEADKQAAQGPPRAERKQCERRARRSRRLVSQFQRARKRDGARELTQASAAASTALLNHGIRHSFRPLPKHAFFLAYMAGCDRNGALALRALQSVNMPRHKQAQVLEAAFRPLGYQPRRNVCTGDRASQERYQFDGRELAERPEEHAAAIRVIQCAVFLWLVKTRTHRPGFSGQVRGFGRGIFRAFCRSGKDAVTGHARGVPGALVALRSAGFVRYHQTPACQARDIDRGPNGHAYNHFWFPKDQSERHLDELFDRILEAAPFERVAVAEQLEIQRRAQAPPEIDPASIPF